MRNRKGILEASAEVPLFLEDALNSFDAQDPDPGNLMQIARQLEMDIHLQRILLKVDRTSMFHSLEVRVPYLSNAMLDYSSGLSWQHCVSGKEGKMNMKQLLSDKFGSAPVLAEKRGFSIPLKSWMRNELRNGRYRKDHGYAGQAVAFLTGKRWENLSRNTWNPNRTIPGCCGAIYAFVRWEAEHHNSNRLMGGRAAGFNIGMDNSHRQNRDTGIDLTDRKQAFITY